MVVTFFLFTFASNLNHIDNMEQRRTREEVVNWLNAARRRKREWEEQTQKELRDFIQERKRAKQSHYFDFA